MITNLHEAHQALCRFYRLSLLYIDIVVLKSASVANAYGARPKSIKVFEGWLAISLTSLGTKKPG